MTKNAKPTPAAEEMAAKGIYSDLPEINQRIIDILPGLTAAGYLLEDARPIPYGSKLTLQDQSGSIALNFYFSKKKGHTTVFAGKVPKSLQQKLRLLLEPGPAENRISPMKDEQEFGTWIGCDEGGKGAFAGSLVAVAFVTEKHMIPDLLKIGVADSKTITGKKLKTMARELMNRYRKNVGIMELKPETYNRLYDDFKTQGKSLNHLLAWTHGKAVENAMKVFPEPEAIVLDQFAYPGVIKPRMPKGPKLIIRTKAEDNIGVAAASVIAGAWYLGSLEKLSEEIGVKLMPGAGKTADEAVVEAVKKHSPDVLNRIVKRHFKNTVKVCRKISGIWSD